MHANTSATSAADVAPQPAGPGPRTARAIFLIAIAFSLFQIYVAAFNPLPTLVTRSLHVGFLLFLGFLMFRARSSQVGGRVPWYDWGLGLLGFALGFYHLFFEEHLMFAFEAERQDMVVGVLVIGLVFEAARRAMGLGLALVCGVFLVWGLFGHHLPAPFDHRGYGFDQLVMQLYMGTEGIYGSPIYVSATYLFLFILFGTFLQQAGLINVFNDMAMGTVGHTRGGPAKVAVVSSGVMGTISGSGLANVVTTGMFTIPLMKRSGYRAPFAGAVEATASMGGQIMPPVMGAVAFIMAETIGVPYVDIVKAATLPALLYFGAVLWMVHLEAGRHNLRGLRPEECPRPFASLRRKWHLMLPLVILVYLLFTGYTPLFAGTIGLLLTVVLIMATAVAAQVGQTALKTVVWIVVGIGASTLFKFGPAVVMGLIGLMAAALVFHRGGRDTVRLTLDSLANGAMNAVGVGLACAVVGVIIGVLGLTGLAVNVGAAIVNIGHASLFLSLVLTMLTCIILGMGIPSIPNYIITSSIAAPILVQLGVPVVVAHMFVFYFGIMANLTPPVALAAFAAAPIANAPAMHIAFLCLRLAIAGFVLPFMAVYAPALMFQGGDWLDVLFVLFKAVIAVGLWGAAATGYLRHRLNWPERAAATAAAFALVAATPLTDQVGLAGAAAFVLWHLLRHRRVSLAAPEKAKAVA